MLKTRNITIERIEKFKQTGQFSDVNLHSTLWKKIDTAAITMSVFSVPNLKRISFDDAIKGHYRPAKVGDSFGPTWSTHWFKIKIEVSDEFKGEEVLLLFDSSSEAMIWSTDGVPLQGLTGGDVNERRVHFKLLSEAKGGEEFSFYIEVACNGLFGAGEGGNGSIFPPVENRTFPLAIAQLAVKNQLSWDLHEDLEIFLGLIKDTPPDSQLGADALYAANKIVDTFYIDRPETLKEAHEIAKKFYQDHKMLGRPGHEIIAIGNCHIDTAWLWPYDETKRKAARSWATQIRLMEDFPSYTFAASQAQQFEWVENIYPKLFEKIKKKADEGQFIPIGGTWVEMDCNLPSGEALCRQFLYGQKYFESRFGKRCQVFWLPDTFGYSAQLPQIVRLAGLEYFFTQKLSWNNINKFPHSTFMWYGLDGTGVLTHFSPADTYTATASVRDVSYAVRNNKDKEYSNRSLLVYGFGDGGGGPRDEMLRRIEKMSHIEGLPASVKFGDPTQFYRDLESTSKDLNSWKGELYFELHRGTYTTHGLIKKGNRKGELALRALEIMSSLACIKSASFSNPKDELDKLWKLLLLNQFHDVLPGSSIEIAYEDPIKFHREILEQGGQLLQKAWKVVYDSYKNLHSDKQGLVVFNPTSWTRSLQVLEVELASLIPNAERLTMGKFQQVSSDGKTGLVLIESIPGIALKSFSFGNLPSDFSPIKVSQSSDSSLSLEQSDEYILGVLALFCLNSHLFSHLIVQHVPEKYIEIDNGIIRVKIDAHGRITSLVDIENSREVILPGHNANVFRLYEDIPLFWDAWDVEIYHLEKGCDAGVGNIEIEESGPLRVVLKAEHHISNTSSLTQRIIVTALSPRVEFHTKVSWNENRKMLKVEFPVNINHDVATYETQFGFIQRPTHYNTSWDFAKFEVCGHKFVDYSEYDYGVTLLNDCKYGFSTHGNTMRMSILRSPKAPDAHCDIGDHEFKYALYPHKGCFFESDAVQQGYEFNVPLIYSPSLIDPNSRLQQQFFSVDKSNIVIDTLKVAEESDGLELVIRMYEAYGGRGQCRLISTVPISKAWYCNVMEDNGQEVTFDNSGAILFEYTPFKVISFRIKVHTKNLK